MEPSNNYLLVKLAEECMEVGKRATKALTFGLDEIQKGQELNNSERISQESDDLIGVFEMLQDRGILRKIDHAEVQKKKHKILEFFDYSKSLGITLE